MSNRFALHRKNASIAPTTPDPLAFPSTITGYIQPWFITENRQ